MILGLTLLDFFFPWVLVVQHNGSDVPLHQMTASAVGNKPEGGMNPAREAAIRSAMHADERLFDFKVQQYKKVSNKVYRRLGCVWWSTDTYLTVLVF